MRVRPSAGSITTSLTPLLVGALMGAMFPLNAEAKKPKEAAPAAPSGPRSEPFDHSLFTDILHNHVLGGRVDYAGLLKDRSVLDKYCSSLRSVAQTRYDRWSKREQLAYWINLYNSQTLYMMIAHPNTVNLRTVAWYFPAFHGKSIPMIHLEEGQLSLNDIEHAVLKRFHEPRARFALVGATKGSPLLRNEAYTGHALETQLEDQAAVFARDPNHVTYDPATSTVHVSRIFDWYRREFDPLGGVRAAVARYADPKLRTAMDIGPLRMDTLEYDWSVNGGW